MAEYGIESGLVRWAFLWLERHPAADRHAIPHQPGSVEKPRVERSGQMRLL